MADNGAGADHDPDGDTLIVTATAVVNAQGSSFSVAADGSFTYVPAAGFSGTESFNYTVKDLSLGGNGDTGTVTFTVVPNAAPVAVEDAYSLDEDTTLTVAAAGVLLNDSDANGDALSAILVDDVTNGTLNLNADGSFSYVPDANFNGPDSFTYKTNDGLVDGNMVTVDLTVNPVDDPAQIVGDRFGTVHEDASSFLGDGTLVASGSLSISDVDGDLSSLDFVPSIYIDSGYGTFSINADGDWQYILDNSSSQVQALAAFTFSEPNLHRRIGRRLVDRNRQNYDQWLERPGDDLRAIPPAMSYAAGYAEGPLDHAPIVSWSSSKFPIPMRAKASSDP